MLFRLALCALVVAHAHSEDEAPIYRDVDSPQGHVRGYKEGDIYVFHSIPYAKAPTGEEKFKAPLEADTFTETFEAVDSRVICPQVKIDLPIPIDKTQQEDCLIATVYAHDTEETNLPVVVYVHGGGYQAGWGDMLPPTTITSKRRIIAVTFNYRLGVHGFLCLGTSAAPGNAGLKDIVALLKWVNKNIASYGGNPRDVTIAGYSAGASAVDLLMLSESATGLYHKIIPDSGTNVASWSIQMDPTQTAKDYARAQGFTGDVDNTAALEEWYTSAHMDRLLLSDFNNRPNSTLGFVPCIERDIGEDRFLDDAPIKILKEKRHNKVPMLYGFTEHEGLYRLEFFDDWSVRMNEKFSDFLPADLVFESEEEKEDVALRVKTLYFGDQTVSVETVFHYIDYFTDVMFAYPTLRAAKLQVEAGNDNVYLYEYSFVAEELPSAMEDVDVRGADHAAQTMLVLDLPLPIFQSNRTKEMQVVMRELWLDFVITGTPVPSGSSMQEPWPPIGPTRGPHMNLDETPQIVQTSPMDEERAKLWDEIYDKHYRMPVAPSSASLIYMNPLLCLVLLFIKFFF